MGKSACCVFLPSAGNVCPFPAFPRHAGLRKVGYGPFVSDKRGTFLSGALSRSEDVVLNAEIIESHLFLSHGLLSHTNT